MIGSAQGDSEWSLPPWVPKSWPAALALSVSQYAEEDRISQLQLSNVIIPSIVVAVGQTSAIPVAVQITQLHSATPSWLHHREILVKAQQNGNSTLSALKIKRGFGLETINVGRSGGVSSKLPTAINVTVSIPPVSADQECGGNVECPSITRIVTTIPISSVPQYSEAIPAVISHDLVLSCIHTDKCIFVGSTVGIRITSGGSLTVVGPAVIVLHTNTNIVVESKGQLHLDGDCQNTILMMALDTRRFTADDGELSRSSISSRTWGNIQASGGATLSMAWVVMTNNGFGVNGGATGHREEAAAVDIRHGVAATINNCVFTDSRAGVIILILIVTCDCSTLSCLDIIIIYLNLVALDLLY